MARMSCLSEGGRAFGGEAMQSVRVVYSSRCSPRCAMLAHHPIMPSLPPYSICCWNSARDSTSCSSLACTDTRRSCTPLGMDASLDTPAAPVSSILRVWLQAVRVEQRGAREEHDLEVPSTSQGDRLFLPLSTSVIHTSLYTSGASHHSKPKARLSPQRCLLPDRLLSSSHRTSLYPRACLVASLLYMPVS